MASNPFDTNPFNVPEGSAGTAVATPAPPAPSSSGQEISTYQKGSSSPFKTGLSGVVSRVENFVENPFNIKQPDTVATTIKNQESAAEQLGKTPSNRIANPLRFLPGQKDYVITPQTQSSGNQFADTVAGFVPTPESIGETAVQLPERLIRDVQDFGRVLLGHQQTYHQENPNAVTVPSFLDQAQDFYNKQVQNGTSPTLATVLTIPYGVGSALMDLAPTADIAARGVLNVTKFDPVVTPALGRLGLSDGNFSFEKWKDNTQQAIQTAANNKDINSLRQIVADTNVIASTLKQKGITSVSGIAKVAQDAARFLRQPLGAGAETVYDMSRPGEQSLPGTRPASGQAPGKFAFGLSTEPYENVGYGETKPSPQGNSEAFQGFQDLSTKLLEKLKGKTTVSKQFISDLTNSPDLKQTEKDLIRGALENEGDKVNVPDFADKVRAELLPLKRNATGGIAKDANDAYEVMNTSQAKPAYEYVNLPDELRGKVKNYSENIYESPIENSAGGVHFGNRGTYTPKNYFGHTRVEDLPGNKTRRVIEVQSDLFQKGRLEGEYDKTNTNEAARKYLEKQAAEGYSDGMESFNKRKAALDSLQPYKNNAAHFRMIREEVKQAAIDGKTKLQFPTGETAMKIEGLGGKGDTWADLADPSGPMSEADLKVGKTIGRVEDDLGLPEEFDDSDAWVITDVLGNGKFKALPKEEYVKLRKNGGFDAETIAKSNLNESFDISEGIDTENPIYKFYEKDVGKYLKNNYNAQLITDPQGVKWWEINVKPHHTGSPVEAFKEMTGVHYNLTKIQAEDLFRTMFDPKEANFLFQKTLNNGEALGRYSLSENGKALVEIVERNGKVSDSVVYHEAFHTYLRSFVPAKERASLLESEARDGESDQETEERLADAFAEYVSGKKASVSLRDFFSNLLQKIKTWIKGLSKVEQVYEDVLSKKRSGETGFGGSALKENDEDLSYEPSEEDAIMKSIEQSAEANTAPMVQEIPKEESIQEAPVAEKPEPSPVRAPMNIGIPIPDNFGDQFKTPEKYTKMPANTLKDLATGPDGPSWASLVKGFSRNLPGMKRAHFFDYLSTPEFVLEKLGIQKGAEMLHDAQDNYRKTRNIELAKIANWQNRVNASFAKKYRYIGNNKFVEDTKGLSLNRAHGRQIIFDWLNGDHKVVTEMNPEMLEVAHEIKAYLKEWAKRLDLPEDKILENYITHIFELSNEKLGETPFDDPDLKVIMDSTPAKSVYDPFLEKRMNKPNYKRDVWAALDAYVKRATRKEAMDPALEEIVEMARKLDGDSYEYVTKLTHRINMRPTSIDNLVDNFVKEYVGNRFTSRPVAFISQKIRQIFFRGIEGLNIGAAVRNLSQGANTYAKLGEKYTVIGYTKMFTRLVTGNLGELYDEGIMDDSFIQDKKLGVYKTLLQRLDPVLFSMFNLAEKINRGAAYYGAKSQYIAKNVRYVKGQEVWTKDASLEQAVKYAKRIVRETQFAFGAVDTPVALSSDIVKTLAQMQTYNFKQIEFLVRMGKNKEWAGLFRYILATLFFMHTIGKLFGMKFSDILPSVSLDGSPILRFGGNLVGAFSSNAQKRSTARSALSTSVADLFPAGGQIKKTTQGLGAYNKGKDTTASGKTRFKITKNPETELRAALFGKSSLPQAQEYYNSLDGGKKKSGAGNPFSK